MYYSTIPTANFPDGVCSLAASGSWGISGSDGSISVCIWRMRKQSHAKYNTRMIFKVKTKNRKQKQKRNIFSVSLS